MRDKVEKQVKEDRAKTRDIEEQKRTRFIDQAPEDKRKTDVIEELKRKQEKS
jgi:hypothetical protein